MEFIDEEEEIDIKYEYDIHDIDVDHDLGSSSHHSTDWKLNPNVECRVMLERMKSLDSEKEVQGNPNENYEGETETSSRENGSVDVDKSCGIYRKLKLLVDVLKNCEKREECELCEKYIQQLQQHLLLIHGNNAGDDEDRNSTETQTSLSAPEPVSLDRNDVPFENFNTAVKIPHDGVPPNSKDGLVLSLSIAPETGRKSTSRDEDPYTIKRKSIPKGRKSKPYKCDTCQMTFLTFYELAQHQNTHIEEKSETKSVREKTPLTPSNSNEGGLPTGRQKKRFKCVSYDLNRHKRIHTGEKPYKCDMCGKFFTQTYTLSEHKLTHTGEKPHRCDLCGKCFTRYTRLTSHKLVHTGVKTHECGVCGKFFAHNYSLTQHVRTHTGDLSLVCVGTN